MKEVYRFRTIEQLLGKHAELLTQTIYFASPEELDDPVEGRCELVWDGDLIVWRNLFKNYTFCLYWAYTDIVHLSNDTAFKATHIRVSGRWDESARSQLVPPFDAIWDKVYNELGISAIAHKIVEIGKPVLHNQLRYYLVLIHDYILAAIHQVHEEHGIDFLLDLSAYKSLPALSDVTRHQLFEVLASPSIDDKGVDSLFGALHHVANDYILAREVHSERVHSAVFKKNLQLLQTSFSQLYIQQLADLLWPRWYTACFTRRYDNSSLWAHYADGHKGVCLAFGTLQDKDSLYLTLTEGTGLSPDSERGPLQDADSRRVDVREVEYSVQLVTVDFFRSIGRFPRPVLMRLWYTDNDGALSECASHLRSTSAERAWRDRYWCMFEHYTRVKTTDWTHEQECRMILSASGDQALAGSQRLLKYDFESLKSITFGMKTSSVDKSSIIEIVRAKCQEMNRTSFAFFQAYYSERHGSIQKHEIQTGPMVAGSTFDPKM